MAARGLDVDEISHVVNYDLPKRTRNLRASHRSHGPCGRQRAWPCHFAITTSGSILATSKSCWKKTPVCEDHPEYAAASAAKASASRPANGGQNCPASQQRAGGPPPRKPHGEGPGDGRQRSLRRKLGQPVGAAAATATVEARPVGYTKMW